MSLPGPLTPADADLRDFAYMPLHVSRLRDSDLASTAEPEACWYAVLLWCAAWHQLPAGSLPNDDKVLCKLIGLGRDLTTWGKHREEAMHGWIECSDGRLYHSTVARVVCESWEIKLRKRHASYAASVRTHNAKNPEDQRKPMSFEEWLSRERPASIREESAPPTQFDIFSQEKLINTTHFNQNGDSPNLANGFTESHTDVQRFSESDSLNNGSKRREEKGREGKRDSKESKQTESPETESARIDSEDGLDRSGDLMGLLEITSAAAGYVPNGSRQLTDALDWIKAWRDAGIDFTETVIPAIQSAILKNPDRTSTLKRFDQAIRLAHAQRSASAKRGPAPPPPAVNLAPDGETPAMHAFRADMLAHLGPRLYAQFLNKITLEAVPTANGSAPLKVIHRLGDPFRLLDDGRPIIAKRIAKKHGFTDIWE